MWEFFDDLEVETGALLFVHSSLKFWNLTPAQAVELIEQLLHRVGPRGGILMPSFHWQGDARPPRGTVYDVQKSPSKMGLISEMFRRWPGVARSDGCYVPVCAWGDRALPLVEGQAAVRHPFGRGSTFRLAYDEGATILGLGVSLNTSSLAHLPDMELADRYPVSMFSEEPFVGEIRDREGTSRMVETIVFRDGVRQLYQPSAMFKESPRLAGSLRRSDTDSTIRFSYPLRTYVDEAVRVGGEALDRGAPPPWLRAWPD